MAELLTPGRFHQTMLPALRLGGDAGERSLSATGNQQADLRPLAGLITFATIIPMAMFVGIYLDRLFANGSDVRGIAILYGGILLAIIAGMSWGAAVMQRLRLYHFLLLPIPFIPIVSLFVMQTDDILLSTLVITCIAQFAADFMLGAARDPYADLFRYIRLILVAMLAIAFATMLAFAIAGLGVPATG